MKKLRRYSKLKNIGDPREIVLLKGSPCAWGRCTFCDYILDNSENEAQNSSFNSHVLSKVTGEFGVLQVINSGSVFELPEYTLDEILQICKLKQIKKIYFESHWFYKDRIEELRKFFGDIKLVLMLGMETFNHRFRNEILKKGIEFDKIQDVRQHFDSICLMVGIKGQTKEMLENDIETLLKNFEHGTINVFVNNSTPIKADLELQSWFKSRFENLSAINKIDVLWDITDFGVGELIDDEE